MTMYVGSLPMMHLLSYGWMLYDNLWGLLGVLSITIFPFTWLLISTVFDSVKRHGLGNLRSGTAAFHVILPSFIVMMAVYTAACVPTQPLDVSSWEYSNLCEAPNGGVQVTNAGSPGSTGA